MNGIRDVVDVNNQALLLHDWLFIAWEHLHLHQTLFSKATS